ncbi:unnamed protein product, partial [Pleuronectes platessa]
MCCRSNLSVSASVAGSRCWRRSFGRKSTAPPTGSGVPQLYNHFSVSLIDSPAGDNYRLHGNELERRHTLLCNVGVDVAERLQAAVTRGAAPHIGGFTKDRSIRSCVSDPGLHPSEAPLELSIGSLWRHKVISPASSIGSGGSSESSEASPLVRRVGGADSLSEPVGGAEQLFGPSSGLQLVLDRMKESV